MKLKDAVPSATHTVLIFGPPKSGKTQLAAELAKHGFILYWFDLENGWVTLLKLDGESQERINLFRIPDTRSFPIAIETMLKVIKGNECNICDDHGKIDCAICKKTNASFSRICLNELKANEIVVTDSLTQLTNSAIAHITKAQPDDYKLNYDDWGNLGKLMDIFLSHVQQAKYNCICITHETEVEMEDGKSKLVPTSGTRNFSRNTAKYFGHCVYVEVKNKQHRAASSTTYATNILSGSRTDVALENSKEVSLLRIFKPELFASEVSEVGSTTPVTQAGTALSNLQRLKAQMAAK